MPGLPLFFTDASGVAELTHKPLPGLYLGDDTFLGEGIWLDQGVAEAFAEQPFLENVGIVYSVTTTPAEATMAMPGLPTFGEIIEIVDPVPAVAFMSMPAFGGQDLVYPVTTTPAIATMPMPGTSGSLPVVIIPSVRELPPLRLTHLIVTPSGKATRWAHDEPNPIYVPSGERFSDTMPGGFETSDAVLPRKSNSDSSDLEPFSTWTIYGAGGQLVWEGRLERAPRASGDQMSVSPSAVGYQAHLDDDKSAQMIGVDIDLGRWSGPSTQRRINISSAFQFNDSSVSQDIFASQPALHTSFGGPWAGAPGLPLSEAWYDAGPGTRIGVVYYAWKKGPAVGLPDANWVWRVFLVDQDDDTAIGQDTGNLSGAGPGVGNISASTTTRRHAVAQFLYSTGPAGGDAEYMVDWTVLGVYGDHGLPRYGTPTATTAPGLLASDVVRYAVSRWAPLLDPAGVQASAFTIPHLVFPDPTTASEIIKGASRFGLQDWAVWDNQTFWWHDRGAYGRKWRARTAPAQLEETGAAADRVWESIVVSYQDTDGSTKTVGPPGSGVDTQSALLKDLDPDNPANRAGITRRDMLQMGTSTAAGAIEVGQRFLEGSRQLDHSGRARFMGHVESDRGVLYPYWAPRAGDTVSFIDASDSSSRRITRTEKDHASRTCSVDLDAPPEGLQALLERLGVVLVPLGL